MTDIIKRLGIPPLPEPLPQWSIDAHTHMDSVTGFSGLGVEDNIRLARQVGIRRLVQIGCDVADSVWAERCAREHGEVIAAVAIHPNEAARMDEATLEQAWTRIDALAQAGDHVRAIGETGLDYYRTTSPAGIERQKRSFARHIEMAISHDLTLAIHDRDAHLDVLQVLDEVGWPQRVIFHCFSGDADFAHRCLAHGAWLSFAGNITYKANRELRGALAVAPANKILAETDAPYLTPMPHRGRANASYLVAHTIRFLAAEKDTDLAQMCRVLRENAETAYGGSWGGPQ